MSVPSHFGRYRVLKPLASGEMGIVYLAEDPLIGRHVAIKSIRLRTDSDDSDVRRLHARFDQEIHIAGTFSHPNIVTLFDVGRQDGAPFIAMEYIKGRDLRAELQASGHLEPKRAVDIAAAVARALAYAHDRKVIHRDIKPTNILMSADGEPKVSDFGIAHLFGSTLTHNGHIFGTPAYMSPEQAIGGELTGASDQFGVASVLYELLTGERPFKGDSPTAVIYDVIENHPAPPHAVAPLVPTPVGEVVMKAMSKDPDDRYADCNNFAAALERAMEWSRAHPDRAFLEGMPEGPASAGVLSSSAPAPAAPALTTWAIRARRALVGLPYDRGVAIIREWLETRPGSVTRIAKITTASIALATLGLWIAWLASGTGQAGAGAAERINDNEAINEALTPRMPAATPLAGSVLEAPVADRGPGDIDGTPAETAPSETLSITIRTRPAAARITLDGKRLDRSSPTAVLLNRRDTHVVRIDLEGYDPAGWSFSLADLSEAQLASGELYFPLHKTAARAGEDELAAGALPWNPESPAPAERLDGAEDSGSTAQPAGGPPPSPTSVRRVRAPAQTPAPEKLLHVDPIVPAGTDDAVVIIEIEVSARGNVVQAKVLRGSTPAVDQAALSAVVRWKYEPTRVSGAPVRVLMTVTLPIGRSTPEAGR